MSISDNLKNIIYLACNNALKDKGAEGKEKTENTSLNDISIFLEKDAFGKTVSQQNIDSVSVKDLTEADHLQQIIDEVKNESNDEENDKNDSGENTTLSMDDLVGALLENKYVKNFISGLYGKEENLTKGDLKAFIEKAAGLDGDESSLSAQDVINAVNNILDSEFSENGVTDYDKIEKEIKADLNKQNKNGELWAVKLSKFSDEELKKTLNNLSDDEIKALKENYGEDLRGLSDLSDEELKEVLKIDDKQLAQLKSLKLNKNEINDIASSYISNLKNDPLLDKGVTFEGAQVPNSTSSSMGTAGTSSSGGSAISNGGSAYRGNYNSSPVSGTKNLNQMNLEELKAQKSEAENDLKGRQSSLEEAQADLPELRSDIEKCAKNLTDYLEKVVDSENEHMKKIEEAKDNLQINEDEQKKLQDNLTKKETQINDTTLAIDKLAGKITSLTSAKSSLETALNSCGDDDSAKAEIQSKINSIEKEIKEAENEKSEKEKELKTLEKEKQEIETNINKIETVIYDSVQTIEKETEMLLSDEELEDEGKIRELKEAVVQAKNNYDKQQQQTIPDLKSKVQEAQEKVNSIDLAISNYEENARISQDYGFYNAQAGQRLAQNALSTRGTTGHCLAGVDDTLQKTYGISLAGLGSAYLAAEALRGNTPGYEEIASHFMEVKDYPREDLASLPAGAIVVWNNNADGGGSNVTAAGKIHGHISIALGDGRESSDHIQSQTVNRDATYTVFLPIS